MTWWRMVSWLFVKLSKKHGSTTC